MRAIYDFCQMWISANPKHHVIAPMGCPWHERERGNPNFGIKNEIASPPAGRAGVVLPPA
jgi:hypothetical protein